MNYLSSMYVVVVAGDSMQHNSLSEELLKEIRPQLHPAWITFIRYCERLGHGEIGRLKIQDGLPVLAEMVTEKVKFS
jgi:hypothetical protein